MFDKLTMHTKDLVQGNIEKIAELFPNCVTETVNSDGKTVYAIDFEALKRQLSNEIIENGKERYVLTWPGKSEAQNFANTSTTLTFRPCREESVNFDTTENVYIEGDNLDALKLLRETYLGKVKVIYIDPPYNTGNDFLYNDKFSMSEESYDEINGDYDEVGNRLVMNSESNGRFHTDWLNMIYPRLLLAKDLMTDDGAIFISIDDNEQSNLKRICDEIFDERNFVTTFTWAAGRKNDSKLVSVSHEYVLCYVRSMEYLREHAVKWRERKQGLESIYAEYDYLKKKYKDDYTLMEKELNSWYKGLSPNDPAKNHKHYNRVDKRGIYFASDISWPGGGGPKYEVLHPKTGKVVKTPSRGWLYSEDRLKELIAEDKVVFGIDETYTPCVKSYLKEHELAAPYSVIYKDGRAATKRLATLMGSLVFQNPKDEEVLQNFIQFVNSENSIILDFFSGSASTAHAVMLQNSVDHGHRKFILVQIPDPLENSLGTSEASKAINKNATELLGSKPHNICEIGKERMRRVGKTISDPDVDVGFRVLKVDSSNMNEVFYNPAFLKRNLLDYVASNIKSDRTPEDLLFQVMIELGIELSVSIEKEVNYGKEVFNVDHGYLVACFDENINDEVVTSIAKQQPHYVVFRDSSMENDAVAINFEQIFKAYSPNTQTKVL